MPTGGPIVNTAPAATVDIAGKRTVSNAWHRTRFYGRPGDPKLLDWLPQYLEELKAEGSAAEGQRKDVLRAAWQYANGWLKEAQAGRPARYVGDTANVSASDAWSRTARYHVDIATCTGGHGAGSEGARRLDNVPEAQRCQSDVCGPVWAAMDAKAAQT